MGVLRLSSPSSTGLGKLKLGPLLVSIVSRTYRPAGHGAKNAIGQGAYREQKECFKPSFMFVFSRKKTETCPAFCTLKCFY